MITPGKGGGKSGSSKRPSKAGPLLEINTPFHLTVPPTLKGIFLLISICFKE